MICRMPPHQNCHHLLHRHRQIYHLQIRPLTQILSHLPKHCKSKLVIILERAMHLKLTMPKKLAEALQQPPDKKPKQSDNSNSNNNSLKKRLLPRSQHKLLKLFRQHNKLWKNNNKLTNKHL